MFSKVTSALLLCSFVAAQTEEEIAKYPAWAEEMESLGYSWEVHEPVTVDGWKLAMFRITNIEITQEYPVLFHAGAFGDMLDWISGIDDGEKHIGLQLADLGYDVWFGNSRGTRFSNININEPDQDSDDWDCEAHWKFDWSDMGAKDTPAELEKIIDISGRPKVTYVGYSLGTSLMYYGLATNQDYFADKVNRFVAMASCIQDITYPPDSYDFQAKDFAEYWDYGLYNWGADDECSVDDDPEVGHSVMSELYVAQVTIADRFQEPIPIDDWANGVTESALVDLGNIDRTPVSIVIGTEDEICLVSYAQRHYDLMTVPEKYIRYEDGDHGMPYRTDRDFMTRFVQTIETGSIAGLPRAVLATN